nr:putative integron gene cassette protein [uncultured bacterium]CAS02640.1 putative integron gene cassette protein [uncultured bacterium]CAS03024.1 putative integron gene cassette protein [uncultured bacterium]
MDIGPMGAVTIRFAKPEDCDSILAAHVGAIRELCRAEYSETQLAGWAERLTPAGYLPAIAKNTFLVAENEGRVVGFAEFAPSRGEVVAMYVQPKHARSGIGTMLFREIERLATAEGVTAMHLSSSLSAVSFYERLGFVAGPRSVHRLGNGTGIPCVAMTKAAA